MSGTDKQSILKRKASEGRSDFLARAMSPGRAVRLALERAAEKGLGLALEVHEVRHTDVAHQALAGHLSGEDLLAVLDGNDGEPAALSIDSQVLAGLVEHQTIGTVVSRPAKGRLPTRVDAALITPFLDDVLKRFATLLNEEKNRPAWLQVYRFGAMAAGPRTLSLALTSHEYHLFDMDVSLQDGAKKGRISLAFPECRIVPEPDADQEDKASEPELFRQNVLMAPAALRAVLARIEMPINALQGLAVGQMVHVSAEALKDTILETAAGDEIARVQFGQVNGLRAVRLTGMGLPSNHSDARETEFIEEGAGAADVNELDEVLAAEAALDALLPPMDDDTLDGFDNDDLSDLDDLINVSMDDIGDPTALATLGRAPAEPTQGGLRSAPPGDGV